MNAEGRFLSPSQDQRVKNTVEAFEAAERQIFASNEGDKLRAATKLLVKPIAVIPAFDGVTISTELADVWAIELAISAGEEQYSLTDRTSGTPELRITLANPWDSLITTELTVAHRLSTGMWIASPQKGGIYRTPVDGIPARSGTTSGSAECEEILLDALGELVPTGRIVPVRNIFGSGIAGSRYITAKRLFGHRVVDAEECGSWP